MKMIMISLLFAHRTPHCVVCVMAMFIMLIIYSIQCQAFTTTTNNFPTNTIHSRNNNESGMFSTMTLRTNAMTLSPLSRMTSMKTISLFLKQNNNNNNNSNNNDDYLNNNKNNDEIVGDTLGIQRGILVFLVIFLINLWSFSIPPEFRRTRFCSQEQVQMYPNSKCKTFNMWVTGIADYYKNGGGIEFDFSLEKDE